MKKDAYRQGAAVVEFAVLLVLILLILAGVVEFGFLWLQSHYINNAAREGARIAAKVEDPTTGGEDNEAVTQAVIDYLDGLYPDNGLEDRIDTLIVEEAIAGTTPGYRVTLKVKVIRIFGGEGNWFFALFAPGDAGEAMTRTAFFADETP